MSGPRDFAADIVSGHDICAARRSIGTPIIISFGGHGEGTCEARWRR